MYYIQVLSTTCMYSTVTRTLGQFQSWLHFLSLDRCDTYIHTYIQPVWLSNHDAEFIHTYTKLQIFLIHTYIYFKWLIHTSKHHTSLHTYIHTHPSRSSSAKVQLHGERCRMVSSSCGIPSSTSTSLTMSRQHCPLSAPWSSSSIPLRGRSSSIKVSILYAYIHTYTFVSFMESSYIRNIYIYTYVRTYIPIELSTLECNEVPINIHIYTYIYTMWIISVDKIMCVCLYT